MSDYSKMTPDEFRTVATLLLGPWVVGGFVDFLFQGILFYQFQTYFRFYKEDKIFLRSAVAVLLVLTTLKSVQAFAVVWVQNVVYFGDPDTAVPLAYTLWFEAGTPIMVALIGLYVQLYFSYRLYVVSRSKILVAIVLLIFVFAFLSICIAFYFINQDNEAMLVAWFACHLSSVFAGDFIMTVSTIFFLVRTKHNMLPQSVGILKSLIRLTLMSAAPAALCALLNLVFSQLGSINGNRNIISTAFNQALPKLYAMSMMYTLNARRSLRAMVSSGNGISDVSGDIRMHTRGTRANTLPGDNFGGISISTETTHHVDKFHGMYDGEGYDDSLNPHREDKTLDSGNLVVKAV
ncbi:hypothetical protein DL96DRAFT_1712394 [Flagelloscypha sp. PMI_526]|nr:hypothetical protein DL96DRAFT_1712394 [Flagelloscypha sp. PMI_526]